MMAGSMASVDKSGERDRSDPRATDRFHPLFEGWARRVRGRLALRQAVTGAALGLCAATIPAALAWKTRHGDLRPYAPLVAIVGAGIGAGIAYRKRWSDTEVALFLDHRFATDETITTAVEMQSESELDEEARAVVVSSAANALAQGDAKRATPALWKPLHLVAPIAIAGLVFIARAPLPAAPVVATPPPGATHVQLQQVEGLEKVAKLAQVDARDEAQKQRLDKISKDAEKLREELNKGLEKRDAQDRIARLRDAIAAERLSLGDGEKRAGLEAAQSKLEENNSTKDAAKALGDHDLEKFDEDMEKLANQREKKDRELAQKKLQEAADAAKQGGAPDVSKALEDEKQLTGERGRRADELRALSKAMDGAGLASGELKSKSEALDREGSDKAARELSDAMGKALDKLTPEERKRVADKLREEAKQQGGVGEGDPQGMKDLADDLATPEGQKKLENDLKDLAKADTESEESKRQKKLDDAENGAGDTEKDIDKQGQGKSKPGDGQGEQGQQGEGQQSQGEGQQGQGEGQAQGEGQGQGGGHGPIPIPLEGQGQSGGDAHGSKAGGMGGGHDTGAGDHSGRTDEVNGETMRSRAHGPLNKASAMPGTSTGLSAGRAGGTANTQGSGGLTSAGPHEVSGVDNSDVPEEYREQVRQYFQP